MELLLIVAAVPPSRIPYAVAPVPLYMVFVLIAGEELPLKYIPQLSVAIRSSQVLNIRLFEIEGDASMMRIPYAVFPPASLPINVMF